MVFNRLSRDVKMICLVIAVAMPLVGCGVNLSEQTAKDRLEQARTAYAQAKSNPLVESYSMKSLFEAEKALQEAERARNEAYSPNSSGDKTLMFDEISRLAYLAERKSQITVALAEGIAARGDFVQLGKEKAELELKKSELELKKSQLEKKQLQQNLDVMGAALDESKRQLSLATSEAERARILADIKDKEAQLAKAKADAIIKELSELQGQLTDRGIVLTIGDVLFATAKSNLNASAQRSMDKISEFLQKNPNRKLLVEGHTDSVGSDDYNLGLSEQRAESVKRAQVDRGIAADRIVTIGYGKKYPVASNDTAAGKQQNRRVEVIILNEGVSPESQIRK